MPSDDLFASEQDRQDRQDRHDPSMGRAEFWAKVAAGVFAMWALMIPLGVMLLRDSLKDAQLAREALVQDIARLSLRIDAYILLDERRVTVIQERQDEVRTRQIDHESRLDRIEESSRRQLDKATK